MTEMPGHHHQIRKRRRGEVANPANTLDGLVAKRADDVGARDSLYKRYLTEAEAIEAPADDQEILVYHNNVRVEIDPDVSTRTCSVCGYQGKWVSEMIRHKRVHTNERPFRCKYCSRTSKWKADLVRHVAKTHGIRVVSKYSRSKTFHNSTSALNLANSSSESNEKRRNCVEILTDLENDKDIALRCRKTKALRLPIMYRCVICLFEQDSVLVLMSHLKDAHNALPYECHSCGRSFVDAHSTMEHFIEKTTCKRTNLKINIAPSHISKNNFNLKPSFALLDEAAKRAAQELFGKNSVITSSVISTRNATLSSTSKFEMKQPNTYEGNRSEITYNCIFCNWTAKKMCAMEEHMRMHMTNNPSLLMQPIDEVVANSADTQMKVSMDITATTEQALATSRYFDFRAVLSAMKQQAATFDPMVLSMQALTWTPRLLSEWVPPGPSAFKQVTPIPEEIIPVTGFTSYPGIHGIQQKKTIQQFNSLFADTVDDVSCNSVTIISNFSLDSRSRNFCYVNSTSSDVQEKPGVNSNLSDVSSSSPNRHISEDVIKAIQHYCQRRNALFSPASAAENKIQRLVNLSESSKNKTSQKNESETAHELSMTRKDEDDFVDVVQIDS
uniref:C2H2-type domain-containing protein n=1 Tax=Elaeophora elaphi TaxID=1147741 RepID=A0A0R3RGI4_9BILA